MSPSPVVVTPVPAARRGWGAVAAAIGLAAFGVATVASESRARTVDPGPIAVVVPVASVATDPGGGPLTTRQPVVTSAPIRIEVVPTPVDLMPTTSVLTRVVPPRPVATPVGATRPPGPAAAVVPTVPAVRGTSATTAPAGTAGTVQPVRGVDDDDNGVGADDDERDAADDAGTNRERRNRDGAEDDDAGPPTVVAPLPVTPVPFPVPVAPATTVPIAPVTAAPAGPPPGSDDADDDPTGDADDDAADNTNDGTQDVGDDD